MLNRVLLVILLFAAAPAGAVWGPTVGGQYFKSSEVTWKGWELGLAAFGPEGQGFWHFAYGQAAGGAGDGDMTTMAARLNFRLAGHQAMHVYAGGGIRRDQIKGAVTRRAWVECVQAGILFCATRWKDDRRMTDPAADKLGPAAAKSLDLGVEAGYRIGKVGFKGFDARAFLLLTL